MTNATFKDAVDDSLRRSIGASIDRRTFVKAAGAGSLALAGSALFAGCAAPAASKVGSGGKSTKRVTVALGWITNVEFAGYWIAQERGYYRDEGLDVTFKGGGTNTPLPHVQVASGTAMFGVNPVMTQLLSAISQGNDLVVLGAQFQSDPGGLLSLAKRKVETSADLPGLKILTQQGNEPMLNAMYRVNGLEPSFKVVPTGFDPGGLVQGLGDAYTCYITNQPIVLEQKFKMQRGRDYEVAKYSDLNCPSYGDVLSCKRSLVESDSAMVEAFVRATVQGWTDNTKDPSVAAKLVVDKYGVDLGLDLAQQTRQNELQIPLTESDLTKAKGLMRIDPAVMTEKMYPWIKLTGVKDLPDPNRIVASEVLDRATGTK